jgi:hypothetical protein
MIEIVFGILLLGILVAGFMAAPPLWPTDAEINKETHHD